jgi:hypothetical protein
MSKRYILQVLILSFAFPLVAQQWKMLRYEVAVGLGTTNVYSDLGGAPKATSLLFIRDITFRNTRPSIYTALRYKLDTKSSLKLNILYGFSKTEDFSGSRNERRAFSSITNLVETSAQYEFYFLQEERRLKSAAMFNRRGMINNYSTIGAYIFAGAGATVYWPDLTLEEYRPTDKYNFKTGIILALPVGVGLKYILSDKWILGWELGYRQTFSDYLDGIITPTSKNFDVYWISTLNVSYRIPTSRRNLPIFLDKQWRRARY